MVSKELWRSIYAEKICKYPVTIHLQGVRKSVIDQDPEDWKRAHPEIPFCRIPAPSDKFKVIWMFTCEKDLRTFLAERKPKP